MRHTNSIIVVVGMLAVGLGTGCASTSKLTMEPMPNSLRYSETVSFGEKIRVLHASTVRNTDDAGEVIRFALSLSARGRHQHAAQFLADAARRFRSFDRQLEVSLLAAAANEYLKAGNMLKFRETIRALRRTASRYQYAAFDAHTAALVSLGDIASGGTKPTELTPSALKALYRIKSTNSDQ